MRAAILALAVLMVTAAVAVLPAPPVHAIDFGEVGAVNKLLDIVSTPQLAPGESGPFNLQLNESYSEPIVNVRLNATIYEYATIEQTTPIDASWPYPYPIINESGSREVAWAWPRLDPGTVQNLSFTILTSADSNLMPAGSVFDQASYFVRFSLEYDGNVSGTLTPFHMASRGFFSNALWAEATNQSSTSPCVSPYCRGNVNLTVLGVDGILVDSSFGVKEPIPQWPFYLLIGLAIFFVALAFLFWVEENPESYPRVAAWWARQRGRLARRRPVRRVKGPDDP